MFDALQVGSKLVIISAIAIVAIIASLRVWRADLDLRQLLSPARVVDRSVTDNLQWLPTRDSNGLYQGTKLVARISGRPLTDESKSLVAFEEIYQSNGLDLDREFEFQKWRLRLESADEVIGLDTSAPQKGRIMKKVVCAIIGEREAF